MKRLILTAMIFGFAAGFCGCQCAGPDGSYKGEDCLRLEEIATAEVSPAGVRTVFQLSDCNGAPIADLASDEVTVLLDDQDIQSEGDVAPVLTQEVDFRLSTMLLLDLSYSIVENGNLQPMLDAASIAAHALVAQGHRVAIYQFAGPPYFGEVAGFTTEIEPLDAALSALATTEGFGTTDLYGSIVKAIEILDDETVPDVLSSETLILFTDGTDEAMASTAQAATAAIDGSDANVFTVGLGGDVNQDELLMFGKDGFEWAQDAADLASAFEAITQHVFDLAHSYYLLGVCSPRVGGWREMTIVVERGVTHGALDVAYSADGFDIVGCDPEVVAFPCTGRECGVFEGFACGECAGTEACTAEGQCAEMCVGDIECGYVEGADCGDCSDHGDGFVCDGNTCVEPCATAECGFVLGLDCGDCADQGATFACSDNACVDACAEAECGDVLGIDCGDCADQGAGFACDDGACVEACAAAECGEILGIDCGECADGLACGTDHLCAPLTLPGATWIEIPAATTTLGCLLSLDPSCGTEEARHEVVLSPFWILSTEVTVEMYAGCVADDACDPSHVATGSSCNYGLPDRENHPVNCIDWDGMREFCQHVGGDLPTEAQWERAMRGDHDGDGEAYWIYPWGSSPAPSCDRAVMNDGDPGCGLGHTDAVGTKPSTGAGLDNMACNVSEWTRDLYGADLGGCASYPCTDPAGPSAGDERVVRGGNWNDFYASAFRTAARDSRDPASASPAVGGRCVIAL
ncbi:MAG: SUMF1/EgtB/PvdO family nonheme iron enzyme [Proteobacteria bacterium]|jgi:iron(II)-dependent oxidoreductase|nr:SUMF1/EgtB/PvdO family nonheme iron enzyme [Pseudomonadota bacterium]